MKSGLAILLCNFYCCGISLGCKNFCSCLLIFRANFLHYCVMITIWYTFHLSKYIKLKILIIYISSTVSASRRICVRTPSARPSASRCSTTGRWYPGTRWTATSSCTPWSPPRPSRWPGTSWSRAAAGRDSARSIPLCFSLKCIFICFFLFLLSQFLLLLSLFASFTFCFDSTAT